MWLGLIYISQLRNKYLHRTEWYCSKTEMNGVSNFHSYSESKLVTLWIVNIIFYSVIAAVACKKCTLGNIFICFEFYSALLAFPLSLFAMYITANNLHQYR